MPPKKALPTCLFLLLVACGCIMAQPMYNYVIM